MKQKTDAAERGNEESNVKRNKRMGKDVAEKKRDKKIECNEKL